MKNYYYDGYQDGYKNAPRTKGLRGNNKAAYENGYKEGQKYRTLEDTRNKCPAYYNREGGSMWNGIGRNYF